MNDYFLGIDIGGTAIKYGIIDNDNNIIHKSTYPIDNQQTITELLNQIIELIDSCTELFPNLETIGIGMPCVVETDKNGENETITMAPNFPKWTKYNIGDQIRKHYSDKKYTIAIENDANAAAIAEMTAGNAKEINNFVYITLGTGIGGAIIINRKIFRGNNGGAGEIGHIIIDTDNHKYEIDENDKTKKPEWRKGTLEEAIGRKGIIELANNFAKEYPLSIINKIDDIDVREIAKAANKQDTAAILCLKQVGEKLGYAIATINHILDIQNFIIGGGISKADIILQNATEIAQKRTLPSVAKVNIIQAKFNSKTGIIGTALLGKIKKQQSNYQ